MFWVKSKSGTIQIVRSLCSWGNKTVAAKRSPFKLNLCQCGVSWSCCNTVLEIASPHSRRGFAALVTVPPLKLRANNPTRKKAMEKHFPNFSLLHHIKVWSTKVARVGQGGIGVNVQFVRGTNWNLPNRTSLTLILGVNFEVPHSWLLR